MSETFVTSKVPLWVGRAAIAAVWFYHGVWNKLLASSGRHAEIVASVPTMAGMTPSTLLVLIGIAEAAIAVWVLTGFAPRATAIVQTLLLVAMNAGGLLWASSQITDPGGMIVQNLALLVLIWTVALTKS